MRANLQNLYGEPISSDGFSMIPRNPKKVFLLRVNPLIHNLPTELALFKIKKWRVPAALAKMNDESVVVLWQDGPNPGIHAIAVPHGRYFMSDPSFYTPATHLEWFRFGFKEVKLRCVYIPPTPVSSTSLKELKMVIHQMSRPRVKLRTGCKLSDLCWDSLYAYMSQGRNSKIPPADETILEKPIAENWVAANVSANENSLRLHDSDNQITDPYALARLVWNALIESIANGTPVSNSTLQQLFRVTLSEIQTVTALIDEVCALENLPRLAAPTLCNHDSTDLYAQPQSTIDKFLLPTSVPVNNSVKIFAWEKVPNPFDFTLQYSSHQILKELEAKPTLKRAAEIYKTIQVRGTAQQIFARLMRRLYGWQCAICGFSMPFALEAAHIKPWPFCSPGERLMASNGLLLCAVHHKLFDAGLIRLVRSHAKDKFDTGYFVKVLAPDSLLSTSKADVDFVKSIDGVAARIPKEKEHQPKPSFLAFRKKWVAEKISHKPPEKH